MLASSKSIDHLKYHYQVFGLTVSSSFPLNELITTEYNENPQVRVSKGTFEKVDQDLPDTTYGKGFIINEKLFYLYLKGGAQYLVNKDDQGNIEATIDIMEPDQMGSIMSWFYGSVLTAILQMNGKYALHASAVSVEGRLHLFCGRSGIGKSTLAAQLHSRGYQLFSDDKCVLTWDEDKQEYFAEPAIQIMRLWQDAQENLNNDDFLENPTQVVHKQNKFQYIIKDENKITDPMPIAKIYLLRNVNKDDFAIAELQGMTKMKTLRLQTHRLGFINALKKSKHHWEFLENIARIIPVRLVSRPKDIPVHQFADFMEKQITS